MCGLDEESLIITKLLWVKKGAVDRTYLNFPIRLDISSINTHRICPWRIQKRECLHGYHTRNVEVLLCAQHGVK